MHASRLRPTVLTCTVLALLSLGAGGCVSSNAKDPDPSVVVVRERGNGPPPHAPAHGYRRKLRRDGVRLVFDTSLDVYVVVDIEDVFFIDGIYLRFSEGRWFASERPRGSWRPFRSEELPEKLRRYTGGGSKSKKGRGKSKP